MIDVTLACGCHVSVSETQSEPPMCRVHQEHRVRNVKAPAPRFTGCVTGPSAKTVNLPAFAGRLKE